MPAAGNEGAMAAIGIAVTSQGMRDVCAAQGGKELLCPN